MLCTQEPQIKIEWPGQWSYRVYILYIDNIYTQK